MTPTQMPEALTKAIEHLAQRNDEHDATAVYWLREMWAAAQKGKRDREALLLISDALFPPPRRKGSYLVDADAYYNLEGVLQDMRHRRDLIDVRERDGREDVSANTVKRVQGQILEVQKLLDQAGVGTNYGKEEAQVKGPDPS